MRDDDFHSEDELVRKAQAGCRESIGLLFAAHEARLEALVYLRTGEGLRRCLDPLDLVQQTYLEAFKSLDSFLPKGKGSFFRWLGGIAENVIRNAARYHYGTRKRGGGTGCVLRWFPDSEEDDNGRQLDDFLVGPDEGGSRRVRRKDRLRRLGEAVEGLREDQREVVILAFIHELPRKEIAARMGRSVDAVSMLLFRSLRRLKTLFGTTDSLHLPSHASDFYSALADCMRSQTVATSADHGEALRTTSSDLPGIAVSPDGRIGRMDGDGGSARFRLSSGG